MITHPTAAELLGAVSDFLAGDLAGKRAAYLALVARNALGIVQREIASGPAAEARAADRLRALLGRDGTRAELDAALCAALRSGAMAPDDPRLLAHLRADVADRLAIDQPKYRAAK